MQKIARTVSDRFNDGAKIIAVALLAVISVVMITQVIARYVFNNSLSWTEELSRYCFIWFNCLGATVLTKTHAHARVSVIDSLFKTPRSQHIYWVCIYIVALAVSVLFIVTGCIIAYTVRTQITPALGISKAIVYAGAPVAGIGMLIHTISHLLDSFGKEKE